jgi:hypothetical protein
VQQLSANDNEAIGWYLVTAIVIDLESGDDKTGAVLS